MRHALLSLSLALLLGGCASLDLSKLRTVVVARASETPARATPMWHGLPIESGQIIVNEHLGADSLLLSLMAERYAPWIHVGLIEVEQGVAYVYESFGVYLPLPWQSPNEHMGGGVRRVTLESFVRRGGIVAVYDPPASIDRQALAEFARDHWRARTPFDGRFDARDASKLYCAEFVARALEAAGDAPARTAGTSGNRSMRVVLEWLHIDSPELLLAGELIDESRRIALLSAHYSTAQIDAYFSLKRELHRRFTSDQRLGSVFVWSGHGLKVRPQIAAYFDAGMESGVDANLLASRMFGVLPGEQPLEQSAAALPARQ